MGFPTVQQQDDPTAMLPANLANVFDRNRAVTAFARANDAAARGQGFNAAARQSDAMVALGLSSGSNVSLGTGMSKGNGSAFGAAFNPTLGRGIGSQYAQFDLGQFLSAVNTPVSASGEDDMAPTPPPAPTPPSKPHSVFNPYNNGDMRTQGDWNRISGDNTIAPYADTKPTFARGIGPSHSNAPVSFGPGAPGIIAPALGVAKRYNYGNPYVGGQNPAVTKPFNPATDSDPPGYFVPHTFPSKSKFGKFANRNWGQ